MKKRAVFCVQLQGRTGRPETIEKLSPEGYFLQPMVDRAGAGVVMWGRQPGETGMNIWRVDLADRKAVKLSDRRAVSGHPFWSADAKRIVYFSNIGMSAETEWTMGNQFALNRLPRSIWIMGRDGDQPVKLTDGPHVDERPCISPDGSSVVFVSDRSGFMNLWSVSTRTGELKPVTRHNGLDYRPIFSPDGDRLAFFTSNSPSGHHDLCVMRWPDGEPTLPLRPGAFKWVHGPFWMEGGKSILLHGEATHEHECALWIVNLQDNRIEKLDLPGVPAYAHGTLDAAETLLVFDSQHDL